MRHLLRIISLNTSYGNNCMNKTSRTFLHFLGKPLSFPTLIVLKQNQWVALDPPIFLADSKNNSLSMQSIEIHYHNYQIQPWIDQCNQYIDTKQFHNWLRYDSENRPPLLYYLASAFKWEKSKTIVSWKFPEISTPNKLQIVSIGQYAKFWRKFFDFFSTFRFRMKILFS